MRSCSRFTDKKGQIFPIKFHCCHNVKNALVAKVQFEMFQSVSWFWLLFLLLFCFPPPSFAFKLSSIQQHSGTTLRTSNPLLLQA